MRIQSKYMSFNNCWNICSSYDFQVDQQRSQRRQCFSQTVLLWFQVLPVLSSALPGAARCVWRPLQQSSQLWDLTTLVFRSDNSQILPEAPRGSQRQKYILLLSKHSSKLAALLPPRSDSNVFQLNIFILARSGPPSSSPNLLNYGEQVHIYICSITASKIALLWPPTAYLQTCMITGFKCISKVAQ
jgi:hypothetical protein